ncbi:MAG: phosphate starvation-inducible protein PsiF [Rhizobacter sp.]|nr:phosphate starvation-inducible protein PsiF [Rhizobacter sp.]
MKHLISVLAVALSSFAVSAHAVDAASAPTKQQSKMTTCNADAGDKKGDERKAFMKTCLSNKPVSAKAAAQQEKMKTCNADAKDKKGDERKTFMKTCLSNKPA